MTKKQRTELGALIWMVVVGAALLALYLKGTHVI